MNKRNEGRQTLPLNGVKGFIKGNLSAGSKWDLGESGDPDRGMMQVSGLSPGERLKAHAYEDWHAILVFDGTLQISGSALGKDDYLLMWPNSRVGEIKAGPEGALLLELSRTARGMTSRSMA